MQQLKVIATYSRVPYTDSTGPQAGPGQGSRLTGLAGLTGMTGLGGYGGDGNVHGNGSGIFRGEPRTASLPSTRGKYARARTES